jgi:hypothetical protein
MHGVGWFSYSMHEPRTAKTSHTKYSLAFRIMSDGSRKHQQQKLHADTLWLELELYVIYCFTTELDVKAF